MKSSLSHLVAGLFCAASLAFAAPSAHAEKIRIGTEASYAPFIYIDASGEIGGLEIDLMNARCARMQAECEFVAVDWDGLIPGLQARRYDAIAAVVSITEERKRVMTFSDPLYSNVLVFVGPKGQDTETTAAGLKGKRVGALRASTASHYLEDNFGSAAEVKLYDSQDNAYLDLAAGRLDLLISDKFPAYSWLQGETGQKFELKGSDIDIADQIGIGFRSADTALRDRFNAALENIKADGSHGRITGKYFPFPID